MIAELTSLEPEGLFFTSLVFGPACAGGMIWSDLIIRKFLNQLDGV